MLVVLPSPLDTSKSYTLKDEELREWAKMTNFPLEREKIFMVLHEVPLRMIEALGE